MDCCCLRRQDDESEDASPISEPDRYLKRQHTWPTAMFFSFGLSMCITVDILQYSMPLAFLPSVLEDRGHSTIEIASAIGVYYWTGFAGGLVITVYQCMRLICACGEKAADHTTVQTARAYIRNLIIGLTVGTLTLMAQAMNPHYQTHLGCRFLQGFAGAFIFFYSFLLSVALFEAQSEQQDFAMTAASCALNVAEVLGSLFGAYIFDSFGQRAVFIILCVASLINQGILVWIMYSLEGDSEEPADLSPTTPAINMGAIGNRSGWRRLWKVLRSRRLVCAVILIVMSAVVKGSVEEMLPFHADHRWGFDPLQIGQLFAIIAVAYIISAAAIGKVWRQLGNFRIGFSAAALILLGVASFGTFSLSAFGFGRYWLWGGLVFYGVALGLTHTPAALFLADAIDHEEGVAKDAVNAIWNTMWEAGGSLGFLLGGLLGEHYPAQLRLLSSTAIACVVAAAIMMWFRPTGQAQKQLEYKDSVPILQKKAEDQKKDYGGTA
eukprot:TRINITY_DN3117_c0_g1_i1.p1 TRINITY_DN3117_c0_g1~~TRINITY_DN3117_c0_g1_i1.p1  ORF type:complete len:494 (-),score=117.88 TRINITY_DN3117_c0_g1_i1:132-1613(-)